MMMDNLHFGTVVWFSPPRGYGYIKPEEKGKPDIFCHYSQIIMDGYKKLEADDVVSYEVGENHKGPMAINITKVQEGDE